jgi:hypothetical protein
VRGCLRDLSGCEQLEETKGISLTSAIESVLASFYKRSFISGMCNCKRPVLMPLIGYARVSTEDQTWGNRGPLVT